MHSRLLVCLASVQSVPSLVSPLSSVQEYPSIPRVPTRLRTRRNCTDSAALPRSSALQLSALRPQLYQPTINPCPLGLDPSLLLAASDRGSPLADMPSPAADDEASSTGSERASSIGGHQESGPAHVESSKTWAIPTANLKPKPSPQQGDSSKSSDAPKNHIHIPKIAPMSSNPEPSKLAVGLEGKYVDEFGNILDWDGSVLGRVEGDLPSMIGRPVSKSGEILDADGEVVGYVAENFTKPTLSALGGGLKVDASGNIYNADNEIVGKLNDTPGGERLRPGASGSGDLADKPSATPGPSEIYLDVKSTHDGIQLIIKIPTVFKNEQDRK